MFHLHLHLHLRLRKHAETTSGHHQFSNASNKAAPQIAQTTPTEPYLLLNCL
jgi:hypothetical protein